MNTTTKRFGLLALAAFGFTAVPASAQQQPRGQADPEQRIERRVDRLDEQLELTDAQEQQIRGILQENVREMQAERQEREARRAEMRQRFEETDRDIAAALTPEQRQKYETLKTERRAKMEQRRGEGRERRGQGRVENRGNRQGRGALGQRGNQLGRLAQELELTDAQQQELRQVFQAERTQWQAWAQANPNATREQRRAYMESRRAEVNAAVEAKLTPEQVTKYRARRDELMQRWQQGGERGKGARKQQRQGDGN